MRNKSGVAILHKRERATVGVALSLLFNGHERTATKRSPSVVCDTPFLCRPMTSTVKRRIKEHALIVRESTVPLARQSALLGMDLLCSLFVHCGNRKRPSRAKRQLLLRHSSGQQARRLGGLAIQIATGRANGVECAHGLPGRSARS